MLNITKVWVISIIVLIMVITAGCRKAMVEVVYVDANDSDKMFGRYSSLYLHGDTLSVLQYGAHFGPSSIMDNLYSFKFRMSGDTIMAAGVAPKEQPVAIYWTGENIDSVLYIDRTPEHGHGVSTNLLSHMAFPVLYTKSDTEQRAESLTDRNIFALTKKNGISMMNLNKSHNITDLSLAIWGLHFSLNDYEVSFALLPVDKENTTGQLQISYNLEDYFRSLKYILKGDSIEILDTMNNKLTTLKEDTAMLKHTRIIVGDKVIDKRFNIERNRSKLNDGTIF